MSHDAIGATARVDDTKDTTPSPRKQAIRALSDRLAPERQRWIERNRFYPDLAWPAFLDLVDAAAGLDRGDGAVKKAAEAPPA